MCGAVATIRTGSEITFRNRRKTDTFMILPHVYASRLQNVCIPVLGNLHVESTSAASLHVLLYLCLPHLLIAPVLNRRGDEEFVPMTTSRFCILAAFVRFLRSAKRYFFCTAR